MSKIKKVDFKKRRNTEEVKIMKNCMQDVIKGLHFGVAGFVVMAWDGSGNTAFRAKSGGIISQDALSAHVFTQLISIHSRVREGETVHG